MVGKKLRSVATRLSYPWLSIKVFIWRLGWVDGLKTIPLLLGPESESSANPLSENNVTLVAKDTWANHRVTKHKQLISVSLSMAARGKLNLVLSKHESTAQNLAHTLPLTPAEWVGWAGVRRAIMPGQGLALQWVQFLMLLGQRRGRFAVRLPVGIFDLGEIDSDSG